MDKKRNTPKLIKRILGFARPFAKLLTLSIFLNVLYSIFTALTLSTIKPLLEVLFKTSENSAVSKEIPTFFETLKDDFYRFIENLIVNPLDNDSTLWNLAALIIILFFFKNIFKYSGTIVNTKLVEGLIKHIRDLVFKKLTSLSVDFFSKSKAGNIISIITNDIAVVNRTAIMPITDILREMTQIIIFLTLLLTISSYLTLIAFSTSVISLLILQLAMKYLKRYATRMQNAMADYTSSLQETLSGIRVVKAYNAEETANKSFMKQTLRYVQSAVKHRKVIQIIPSVNEIFAILALSVVLFVGGTQVFEGSMKSDDLFLFIVILFSILSPISIVVNNISQFQHGLVAAERVFGILDQKTTVQSGTEEVTSFEEKLELKNVSFAYNLEPVIKGASVELAKNKKIALVGSSGCGKSTMLDLLIRFYDPNEGEILLDGRNIKDFTLESYRSLFGIVAQETMLFNDTVANNIRFGMESAGIEEVMEAAKLSNAYNFIMNMENGFDTYVGDRGVLLSGGERQRIAIARALLANPRILIFDEATSALDAESEKIVQEAIDVSLKDRTAVIVAHRLATIINCDEILVFDQGEITERGTHSELLEKNGVYRKLYDIQFAQNGE